MRIKIILKGLVNRYSHLFRSPKRVRLAALILLVGCLLPTIGVAAITTISQGFSSSDRLSLGSLVSLQQNSTDQVDAASTANVGNLFGVVVAADNSLLSLTDGQSNQVQVATSGIVQILVSNINGSIQQGDHVTASPISGVGMKTTTSVKVIGIAQSKLDGTTGTHQSYTDKSGVKHGVIIGEIPVLLNVSYYFKQPDKTIVPTAIQSVADALAGKSVSSLPIFISAAIFVVTLIVVVSIIYSLIRSSIISVGRNPMSQSAVYRGVIQLSALVLVILGVAFGAIYMVLTRL